MKTKKFEHKEVRLGNLDFAPDFKPTPDFQGFTRAEFLKKIGDDGWELVSVVITNKADATGFFKREKVENKRQIPNVPIESRTVLNII